MRHIYNIGIIIILVISGSATGKSIRSDAVQPMERFRLMKVKGVPHEINYQGWLGTADDTTAVTGTFTMVFKIYDAETGGSNLWSETHEVQVSRGVFNVILGSSNPIPTEIFTGAPLWLEISVADEVLSPRQKLVSVGYAIHAESAQSADVASHAIHADTAGYVEYVDSAGVAVNAWMWNNNMWGVEYPKANIADTATYADTAGYAHVGAPDNDWVLEASPANYLRTYGDYGIARKGAVLYGSMANTHVNLGVACTTGTAGNNWRYCTVSGGWYNTASSPYATVGGGHDNTASGSYATVGGGDSDTASGSGATVGGGFYNTASGYAATVGGGVSNTASGGYATVGGGDSDTANGSYATVGGGRYNTASSSYATVGGGHDNTASGSDATVGGGWGNTASSVRATVGGGYDNTASGSYTTVGGGYDNTASFWYATVGGGKYNTASGDAATVGGGESDTASGSYATVSGGRYNTASSSYATVSGGQSNTAGGNHATVGGGWGNTASGNLATVSGGDGNTASSVRATVGGGMSNTASGAYTTIGGGDHNTASGSDATVGGGYYNTASGGYATVGGGWGNTAGHYYATVGGGKYNTASGDAATIPGGKYIKVTGTGSFAFGVGNSFDTIRVTDDYLVVFGDGGANNYKFGINRENPGHPLHVGTDNTNGNGAHLTAGGVWTDASSRELKEDLTQLDGKEVLDKLKSLLVCMWRYKGTNEYHIGPMAEDFYKIFGTGTDDKYLSSSDVSGVALIAIKELIREIEAQQEEIKLLENRVAELEQLLKEGK